MVDILEAQREMRRAFLGGLAGQLVAGVIWAVSAAVSTWIGPTQGMATLFFGCMLLFPLTQLMLRAMGRPAKVSRSNSLDGLARQIAFTVPLNFLLVGAATLYRQNWFFPAAMIAVGTHYLPFIFLYGMREFGLLAALLVGGGIAIGLYLPDAFSLGGWVGAACLVAFAMIGRNVALREERVRGAEVGRNAGGQVA